MLKAIAQAIDCKSDRLRVVDTSETTIPDEIADLAPHLISLCVWRNQLLELPTAIRHLSRLEQLYAFRNQITAIPPEIAELRALEIVFMYKNRIEAIPPVVGALTALHTLGLYSNRIKIIPPEIGALVKLRTLDLSRNAITVIPSEVSSLQSLTQLNLSHNRITRFPIELISVPGLKELSLSHNEITSLPPIPVSIESLPPDYESINDPAATCTNLSPPFRALRQLDLSHNRLLCIPATLSNITALRQLDLSSNPMSALPQEMAKLAYSLTHLELPEECVPPNSPTSRLHSPTNRDRDTNRDGDGDGDRDGQLFYTVVVPSLVDICCTYIQRNMRHTLHRYNILNNSKDNTNQRLPSEMRDRLEKAGRRCYGCAGVFFGQPSVVGRVAGGIGYMWPTWLSVVYCSPHCVKYTPCK